MESAEQRPRTTLTIIIAPNKNSSVRDFIENKLYLMLVVNNYPVVTLQSAELRSIKPLPLNYVIELCSESEVPLSVRMSATYIVFMDSEVLYEYLFRRGNNVDDGFSVVNVAAAIRKISDPEKYNPIILHVPTKRFIFIK